MPGNAAWAATERWRGSTTTTRAAPPREGRSRWCSRLVCNEGQRLRRHVVQGAGLESAHVGLHQRLRDEEIQRNQGVVIEHHALRVFQQMPALVQVGGGGGLIDQGVERGVLVSRVIVLGVGPKGVE